jgi:hypothetical protein
MTSRRDDLPPTGEEAKARHLETVMPLIWALLGFALIVAYSLWAGFR